MVILGFVGWKRALRKILGSHYAFEVNWFNIIASLEGYREDWIFYLFISYVLCTDRTGHFPGKRDNLT